MIIHDITRPALRAAAGLLIVVTSVASLTGCAMMRLAPGTASELRNKLEDLSDWQIEGDREQPDCSRQVHLARYNFMGPHYEAVVRICPVKAGPHSQCRIYISAWRVDTSTWMFREVPARTRCGDCEQEIASAFCPGTASAAPDARAEIMGPQRPESQILISPRTCRFQMNAAGQHIEVLIRKQPLVRQNHRIEKSSEAGAAGLLIDGKPPIGTDGELPQTEIASFEVKWNGRRVSVPRSLYADCFNPNLAVRKSATDDSGDILFTPSTNGRSLTAEMQGGDGAGVYVVTWEILANGRHKRTTREGLQ